MPHPAGVVRWSSFLLSLAAWLAPVLLLAVGPGARADHPVPTDRAGSPDAALTRIRTGHFVVQASVQGQPLQLVVDTGSPVTVIDDRAYRRLAATDAGVKPEGRTLRLRSLNGQAVSVGRVADLRVGGVVLGNVAVAVTSLGTVLGNRFDPGGLAGADGILGADLLSHDGAIIDLGRRTLSLDATHDSRRRLAQQAARDGYTAVAMSATSGIHLAVPCILQDDPYRLVVDTGSPFTVVQRSVVAPEVLARPARVSTMRTLGGVNVVAWVPLEHWNIGAFPITRATVGAGNFHSGLFSEHTSSGGAVVGLFGLEWLVHWGAIIDFGSRTIYLKHP